MWSISMVQGSSERKVSITKWWLLGPAPGIELILFNNQGFCDLFLSALNTDPKKKSDRNGLL